MSFYTSLWNQSAWVTERMAWSSTIIHTDWTLRQLNPMRHTSILSGGRVQGYEMPSGNAAKRLSRLRGCQSSGPNKNRKKLVSKNISGPGREYALLTRHHWKHKPWTTRRGDVTFPAVVKSISNREALYGSGWSKMHREKSKESRNNLTWKTGGLDKVPPARAGFNLEKKPV